MIKSKILNRIFILVLIIIFISTLFVSVYAENEVSNDNTMNTSTNSVRQLSLQEQKNQVEEQLAIASEQLQYVEGEISENVIQIQNLEDQLKNYQIDYEKVNQEYLQLQERVTNSEKDLDKLEKEYKKEEEQLREKLVQIYKNGSSSYLDVLLNSTNMIDFISNYYMVQKLTEYDSSILANIKKKKEKVEKDRNELKEAKAELKIKKAEAEKQTVILTNTKTILENYKASLTESELTIASAIDSYKRQQEELTNLINYAISGSTYELFYTGGIMIWPTYTSSHITSPFGSRLHPIQGVTKNHDGIDIGGHTGDPIYAAADGVVIYSGWMGGYGNATMVDHGYNGEGVKIVTLYGHGSKLLKEVGDVVKQGDTIMEVGSTGNSTGPHVHFEVRENGTPTDPKKYLSSNYGIENETNDEQF